MKNLTGESLKGYELLERVGSGGFGAVYRAYQSTLGREVAVKVILPGYANHPYFIRRFEAEAQMVARLEHLHIVPLYDYWREPGGAYLVMRWLRGGSVRDALAERPFDLKPAALLLDQITSGLATAHARGIVHRDLKPSNILLDEEGNAYVADFGIAKDLRQPNGELKEGETIVGSPDYLSPEQARAQPVTPQTDIYSLGVTLYEILTGEHPFPGKSAVDRLFKHIDHPLPQIETLPSDGQDEVQLRSVNEVIQRATAKDPQERYEDVLEMAAAFREAARLDGESPADELLEELTLREQEVLHYILEGLTNRQIAQELYIERSTVKWHIRQLYDKLGVRSRRQAMIKGRELELLVPGEDAGDGEEETTSRISVALPRPVNPYKGLRAFETADGDHFFGREALVEKLVDRLSTFNEGAVTPSRRDSERENGARGRFLAVVGPSGSGKSSLVKAGLIPALRGGAVPGSDRWFVVEMAPGARPLDELEVALIRVAADQAENVRQQLERDEYGLLRAADLILPKDDGELLLVIDQFEETFTFVADDDERAHFLNILAAAVTDPRSRVSIVLSLRADYYDRPLHYAQFGEQLRRHLVTVLPLSAEELKQAIEQPAEQVGVRYEEGLVTTIIGDTLYQPGALPLLQYALTELFEQRDGRLLTREAYEATGGVTGALAKRAEELYQEHDEEGREAVRQLFLRLVTGRRAVDVEEESDVVPTDIRRRVSRSELTAVAVDAELMEEIVENYARYRLLTLDHEPATRRPTVEVAHEALLREWERLRRWLEESFDDVYQHRRLQTLTRDWLENGRDPGLLLRETRLDQFAAWAANTDLALTGDEQDFLEASVNARRDRRAEEGTRRQRELETAQALAETERLRAAEQAQAIRRLRWLVTGLAAILVVAIGASLLAWAQSNRAERQARRARARELAAAAISNLDVDPERSILLALQALETTHSVDGTVLPDAEDALHQAVQASRTQFTVPGQGAVAYSPDGARLATSRAKEADIWDAATRERILTLSGHSDAIRNLAFSGDGRRLATTSLDNTARVWDAASGELLLTVNGPPDPEEVLSPALDPDGSLLAATGSDGSVRVWQVPSGEPLLMLRHQEFTVGIAFSPDGGRLATASFDDTAKIWAIPSGRELLTLAGHTEDVNDVAFSPDGGRLATASTDGTAKVWDSDTGESIATMFQGAWVFGVDFSPDGSRIATGGQDGVAKVWDAATGQELLTLAGHSAGIGNLAFSPGGKTLATASTDGTTRLWDISPGGSREWLTLIGHDDLVFGVAYAPDGTRLATASWDGTAKIWDAITGEQFFTLSGHTDFVNSIIFSPDGKHLATTSYDGTARVWDAASGSELLTLHGHDGEVYGVAFSPDGARLVTSGTDGTLKVWDAESGTLLHSLDAHQGVVFRVNFSPDGSYLATAGWDGMARIWDTASWEEALTLAVTGGPDGRVNQALFNEDSSRLITADADGTAEVWEISTALDGGRPPETPLLALAGHTGIVWDVAFSPDESRLVSAGFDGLIKVWDATTGEELLTLPRLSVGPDIALSPNGSHLAAGSSQGTVPILVLEIDELIDIAHTRLTRSLTPAECRQYLHSEECPDP